jgi:hypothetical protein
MAQVTLGPGYQIVFEAIDPTDGSPVSGVVVSNIAIGAADGSAGAGSAVDILPLLVPTSG